MRRSASSTNTACRLWPRCTTRCSSPATARRGRRAIEQATPSGGVGKQVAAGQTSVLAKGETIGHTGNVVRHCPPTVMRGGEVGRHCLGLGKVGREEFADDAPGAPGLVADLRVTVQLAEQEALEL